MQSKSPVVEENNLKVSDQNNISEKTNPKMDEGKRAELEKLENNLEAKKKDRDKLSKKGAKNKNNPSGRTQVEQNNFNNLKKEIKDLEKKLNALKEHL